VRRDPVEAWRRREQADRRTPLVIAMVNITGYRQTPAESGADEPVDMYGQSPLAGIGSMGNQRSKFTTTAQRGYRSGTVQM
jgi:hypothetical protein